MASHYVCFQRTFCVYKHVWKCFPPLSFFFLSPTFLLFPSLFWSLVTLWSFPLLSHHFTKVVSFPDPCSVPFIPLFLALPAYHPLLFLIQHGMRVLLSYPLFCWVEWSCICLFVCLCLSVSQVWNSSSTSPPPEFSFCSVHLPYKPLWTFSRSSSSSVVDLYIIILIIIAVIILILIIIVLIIIPTADSFFCFYFWVEL